LAQIELDFANAINNYEHNDSALTGTAAIEAVNSNFRTLPNELSCSNATLSRQTLRVVGVEFLACAARRAASSAGPANSCTLSV